MFGVEEWSLQHIFNPNLGAKQAKTPHVALMNHPLITTIYFGTDDFIKTADILLLQDYMYRVSPKKVYFLNFLADMV